jgi:hypothetical protein
VLVTTQVALSLVLVMGALLFSGSLRKLLAVETGFRQNAILIATIDFRRLPIRPDRRVAFKEDLLAKLRALPGVDGAGEVDLLPLGGASTSNNVWTEGSDSQESAARLRRPSQRS